MRTVISILLEEYMEEDDCGVTDAVVSDYRQIPEYREYYARKYAEVPKHQHKRALALTSRKFVRLVFGLLAKNQLYSGETLDAGFNNRT